MSKRGRPASQQPKTAYDYRRAIALVQTLAHYNDVESLLGLCAAWDVEPVRYIDWGDEASYVSEAATIRKLAQHVLAHGREEAGGDE